MPDPTMHWGLRPSVRPVFLVCLSVADSFPKTITRLDILKSGDDHSLTRLPGCGVCVAVASRTLWVRKWPEASPIPISIRGPSRILALQPARPRTRGVVESIASKEVRPGRGGEGKWQVQFLGGGGFGLNQWYTVKRWTVITRATRKPGVTHLKDTVTLQRSSVATGTRSNQRPCSMSVLSVRVCMNRR
jgi:hypothetical protein